MVAGTDLRWTYKDATPYEVLGVERDCTKDEIRAAWRKLTLLAHPDRGGTSALFVLTQSAYELLIDQDRRRDFDESQSDEWRRDAAPAAPKTDSATDHSSAEDSSASSSAKQTYSSTESSRASSSAEQTYSTRPSSSKPGNNSQRKGVSVAWCLVTFCNLVVLTHYRSIVAANNSKAIQPSHGLFDIIDPSHVSSSALTYFNGNTWIPYASAGYLLFAVALYFTKGHESSQPKWMKVHRKGISRGTLAIGLLLTIPLMMTGIMWFASILLGLLIIGLIIAVVIGALAVL